MILNEKIEFESLPSGHQAAFINRSGYRPEKKLLNAGMLLYKFNNDEQSSFIDRDTKQPAMSPWWSPYESYAWDAGWAAKENMAKANGISVREWGRLTSAVSEDWNSMEFLVLIKLKVNVYGWFGGFTSQPRMHEGKDWQGNDIAAKKIAGDQRVEGSAKFEFNVGSKSKTYSNKRLPGGATQFYIPGLTPALAETVEVKSLKYQ